MHWVRARARMVHFAGFARAPVWCVHGQINTPGFRAMTIAKLCAQLCAGFRAMTIAELCAQLCPGFYI